MPGIRFVPSTHLSASTSNGGRRTGATKKDTCKNCQHTVYVTDLADGRQVITDSELITVLPDRGGQSREPITARRVHGESCERLKSIAEKEALRKERVAWEKQQARRGSRTKGL